MRYVGLAVPLTILAVLACFAVTLSVVGAAGTRETATFRGPIGYVSDPTGHRASGHGTITIALTADRADLTRVDVEGLTSTGYDPLSGQTVQFRFSRELYFDPPLALANRSFQVSLPGTLVGMVRDSATISGHLESDAVLLGSVQWAVVSIGSNFTFPAVDWAANSPVGVPPGLDDAVHFATFDHHVGSLAYTTNANSEITSLDLKVANLTPCFPADRLFDIRFVLESPATQSRGVDEYVSDATLGLLPFHLGNVTSSDGTTLGDLTIARGLYDDCRVTLHWMTGGAPALGPPSTLPPNPIEAALPASGAGPGRSRAAVPIALMGAGVELVLVGILAAVVVRSRRKAL